MQAGILSDPCFPFLGIQWLPGASHLAKLLSGPSQAPGTVKCPSQGFTPARLVGVSVGGWRPQGGARLDRGPSPAVTGPQLPPAAQTGASAVLAGEG